MNRMFLTLTLLTSMVLGGCAAWYPETEADAPADSPTVARLLERVQQAERKAEQESAFATNEAWLVGTKVKESPRYPYLQEKEVELAQFNRTLPEIISRLSETAGVNIALASDLYISAENGSSQQNAAGPGANFPAAGDPGASAPAEPVDTSNVMSLIGSAGGTGKAEGRFADPLKTPISFSVNGTAWELFENIATQLGISWKYSKEKNQVTFFRLTRKNFQVFFPGKSSTEISTGGDSSGEDSVMSQESDYTINGGSWEELAKGVKALLTPYGKATVIKSTGNIVVVDTPEAMKDIEGYITDVNNVFGRQVYLQIRTANITVENTNDFNITWNNILNTVNNGDFQVGLNSADIATSSIPTSINVIRSATGASLALELLAQQTKSTETNEQSVTTLSNQPASLKVLTETGYISGISQQENTGQVVGNVVSDVETDTVNTGFNATLVPRVINETTLQLQVALELSNNLQLVTFDETIVQTPTQDRNSVVQRAWLRSGQTWVLSAFNTQKSKNQKSGTGSAGFWGLGGGTSKSNEQQILLVLITPYIQRGAF